MAPEAVKKYAFRRRFQKHNYSLLGAELSDEDEEDAPVTPAGLAAAAAGLDAAALSHVEERDFAHITKGGDDATALYLSLRCDEALTAPPRDAIGRSRARASRHRAIDFRSPRNTRDRLPTRDANDRPSRPLRDARPTPPTLRSRRILTRRDPPRPPPPPSGTTCFRCGSATARRS